MSQNISKQAVKYLICGFSSLAIFLPGLIPKAYAGSITFSATGTNPASGGTTNALGASVLFDDSLNPGKLTVVLTNTGPGASVPSDVLTAVFWDYNDSSFFELIPIFSYSCDRHWCKPRK